MTEPVAARLSSRGGEPLVLKGAHAEGDVRGSLLTMKVEQRFHNPSKESLEVVYTFPLPWKAVLLNIEVELGVKRLTGSVAPKARAEEHYEEALSQGDAAIMLEQNYDDSFSLNLGNLAPGEDCKVILEYAQTLSFEHRSLRVTIPTVIAPRYGDPQRDAGLRPHQAVSHDITTSYSFDILVRLHGDLAKARVATPNHPTSVESAADVLTVRLASEGALDRDFVLVADKIEQASVATMGPDAVEPGHVAIAASFCPSIDSSLAPRSIAVKLLVDCSGSMAGDSINAAKRALSAVMVALKEGDRFSLSRFGSNVEHRCRSLWPVTDVSRLAAQRWVGTIQADLGGTNMVEGLGSTFNLPTEAGADVLLITDGHIHAIESTVARAKNSGHRLFIVGVGSSVSQTLLQRLAEETGGSCDFVSAGEAVQPAVERMFARLRCPRISGLHVEWPADATPIWSSAMPLSLFDQDSLAVYALVPEGVRGPLRLSGQTARGERVDLAGTQLEHANRDQTTTASRMTAAMRVAELEDRSSTSANERSAESLAVAYQLVTKATNFILTHERAQDLKATDMPKLHAVQSMVPAGYAATSRLEVMYCSQESFEFPTFLRRSAVSAPPTSATGPADAFVCGSATLSFDFGAEESDLCEPVKEVSLKEFAQWLCDHSVGAWPSSMLRLVEHGIPSDVTLWLRAAAPGAVETDLVRVFLQWLASPEVLAAVFATSPNVPLSWDAVRLGEGAACGLVDYLKGGTTQAQLR